MKKITVGEAMMLNNIIYKLIEQQIHYPINIAYKIYKLKQVFDDVENIMMARWNSLLGENFDMDNLTDEQYAIYAATISADIDVDLMGLTVDELVDNDKVVITITDMERLSQILK